MAKIVVAGSTTANNDSAIARLNSNGTLDSLFDTDGLVTPDLRRPRFRSGRGNRRSRKNCHRRLYKHGWRNGPNDFAITRLTTSGTPDLTFDADGLQTVDFVLYDAPTGVVIQPDGGIVVGGFSDGPLTSNFAVARLNANGALDRSFDMTGRRVESWRRRSLLGPGALAQRQDRDGWRDDRGRGKWLECWSGAAQSGWNPGYDVRHGRRAIVDFGSEVIIRGIAVQPDGQLVLAGGKPPR